MARFCAWEHQDFDDGEFRAEGDRFRHVGTNHYSDGQSAPDGPGAAGGPGAPGGPDGGGGPGAPDLGDPGDTA